MRLLVATAALLAQMPAAARAQITTSHLPPTPPTSAGASSVIQPAPIPMATANRMPGHHAFVSYANGQLNVRADNSSLNVILRDIAEQTGMRISGGVADQRVFGNYGPGDAGSVLATLLDGTGVNILLKQRADRSPAELILTPRTAGATPPSPQSAQFDAEARAEALSARPAAQPASSLPNPAGPKVPAGTPATGYPGTQPAPAAASTPVPDPAQAPVPDPNASPITSPPSAPQPLNNVNGSPANTSPTAATLPTTDSVPSDALPTPPTTPAANGIVDAPNRPPAGTTGNPAGVSASSTTIAPDGTTTNTTVTAPNGVKTPDEIYQQLLKLQHDQQMQQQQKTGGTQAPPKSGPNP